MYTRDGWTPGVADDSTVAPLSLHAPIYLPDWQPGRGHGDDWAIAAALEAGYRETQRMLLGWALGALTLAAAFALIACR